MPRIIPLFLSIKLDLGIGIISCERGKDMIRSDPCFKTLKLGWIFRSQMAN